MTCIVTKRNEIKSYFLTPNKYEYFFKVSTYTLGAVNVIIITHFIIK